MDDLTLERYIAGDCSETERAEVEAWLREHPSEQSLRLLAGGPRTARDWKSTEEWQRLTARIASDSVSPAQPPLKLSEGRRLWRAPWQWAAAAALVISAVALGVRFNRAGLEESPSIVVASTGRGEHRAIQLRNGTVAVLGPMTTLRATERVARSDIELLGTARFQVVHDSTRLFVVHARDLETTDVGTEFAVRAYEGETERAVAVYEGSVSARSSAGRFLTAGVLLQKGDIGVVDRSGNVDVRHDADIARLTEWEHGRIAVNDRPLSQVATELQRWFDVDIRIADQRLANRRVTAVYNAASLDNILAALSEGLGIDVATDGRVITLSSSARR